MVDADHREHLKRKLNANNFKIESKSAALRDEVNFIQFDLEAVLYCPQVTAKSMFYNRRLVVYNLTVFESQTKKAGRGSSEIWSCIFTYLKQAACGKKVIMMSDTCSGQNRNSYLSAFLIYCDKTLDNPIIEHGYFEPGHSFMKFDTVHGTLAGPRNIKKFLTPLVGTWASKMQEKSILFTKWIRY